MTESISQPSGQAEHLCRKVARVKIVALLAVLAAAMACEAAAPAPPAGANAIAIVVRSEPPGATILVDGAAVGAAPAAVKLNPGPHRLRASMSGYYPAPETKIQVGASEPKEHTLTLVASH
jgi:hypothetical protein